MISFCVKPENIHTKYVAFAFVWFCVSYNKRGSIPHILGFMVCHDDDDNYLYTHSRFSKKCWWNAHIFITIIIFLRSLCYTQIRMSWIPSFVSLPTTTYPYTHSYSHIWAVNRYTHAFFYTNHRAHTHTQILSITSSHSRKIFSSHIFSRSMSYVSIWKMYSTVFFMSICPFCSQYICLMYPHTDKSKHEHKTWFFVVFHHVCTHCNISLLLPKTVVVPFFLTWFNEFKDQNLLKWLWVTKQGFLSFFFMRDLILLKTFNQRVVQSSYKGHTQTRSNKIKIHHS